MTLHGGFWTAVVLVHEDTRSDVYVVARFSVHEVARSHTAYAERPYQVGIFATPGIAHAKAVRITEHVLDLVFQLKSNEQKLDELVRLSVAAPLREEKGFREVTAAKCFVAGPHEGRVRSEAAFACQAGMHPALHRRVTRCFTG